VITAYAKVADRLHRVLERRLRPAVHPARVPMTVTAWAVDGEPVAVGEALKADFQPFAVGTLWGPPWGTLWLRCTATVPEAWAGGEAEALVDLGFTGVGPGFTVEGLAYTVDGEPIKGIHPRNRYVPVTGDRADLLIEAAANPSIHQPYPWDPTDLGDVRTAGTQPLYRFGGADLALVDPHVRDLVADLEVLDGLMAVLPDGGSRRREVLDAVVEVLDDLDRAELTGTWSAERARELLTPVLGKPATASAHRVTAVGHAHIDSAWLWPIRETVRKVTRTVANVLALAADHPDLVFAFSQAQQHAWLREHQPALFERLRAAVATGTVVPVGGMWVESDANLPGGEAMVRQLVHGKRFFAEQYGVETDEIWLPDSFGYSAALPQIFRLAGTTRFVSQKMSWNQTNPFPHTTFWWEGLDGSRVLAHFPPVDTYNSDLSAAELTHAARTGTGASLIPFGWGDGGGGPTREMLAHAERQQDLEGLPRVRLGTPAAFFDSLTDPGDAVWSGELYLETHRGTFTTQAAVKRGNRHSEHLLREAELWCATAATRGLLDYPYDELDRIWKLVLLHQFHDILPGSSIAWVYREAAETYAGIARDLEALIGAALEALAGTGARELTFNAAPHARDGVPALGAAPAEPAAAVTAKADEDGWVLDNGLVRVRADRRGQVVSVVDRRAGRELAVPGEPLGLLRVHADHPAGADAWDVDEHYRAAAVDLLDAESVTLEGTTLVTHRRLGDITAVQRVWLEPGAVRVEFAADLDWPVSERLCKAVFPLDLRADTSAAEIQFGHVRRPLHRNTSWETAKYELYAHRFVHVGEPGYGAALVNDGTYGYDAGRTTRVDGGTTTTVGLSLVRSPRFPDPHADQGRHTFRYALAVGASVAGAVREGYRLNLPVRHRSGAADVPPLVAVDGDAVVESVKLADDRSGDVIVRIYEPFGNRCRVKVSGSVVMSEVDLLERRLADVPLPDGVAALELRPFEIRSLRLTRKGFPVQGEIPDPVAR
jgi:alpha-mannosidase